MQSPLLALLAFLCAVGFFTQKGPTMSFVKILFGIGFGFFAWAFYAAMQVGGK